MLGNKRLTISLHSLAVWWPDTSARDNHLACNFARYSLISKIVFFSLTDINKPFLIRLLTTPPGLKYVATLPCNLSLIACFLGVMFSQGSVASYARGGGIFNNQFPANLPRNLPVKKNW